MTKCTFRSTRSCKKYATKFAKKGTVDKSKKENESGNSVKEVQTIIDPKKLPRLRKKSSASISYKETSNSEEDEKLPKVIKFSNYATVSKSKSEVHSKDSVKELLTVIHQKKQLSNQQIKHPKSCKKASDPKISIIHKEKKLSRHLRKKRPASMSYKESSNSEDDEKPPKITKFSKYVTVSKSISEELLKDSVKEVLTVIYPKKQLSNQQIKHSKSCKKASDPKVSIIPKEEMTKLSCRTTRSHSKKCETQFSKYVTVGMSKSETDSENTREVHVKTCRKKQFDKQHMKCPTAVSHKEVSNSKSAETHKVRITKFSPQNTHCLRKRKVQISKHATVCKSKSDNIKEILTIVSPKKQFKGQHIKRPAPLSYKEASNSESEIDYENDIRKTQIKTYRQKRFSKRHIKQPTSMSYKEASDSEGEESLLKKRVNFLPKKQFDSPHMKCPTPLNYKETSNSESKTDSENDFRKIHIKAYLQKRFSKRHIKQPICGSYKEASDSEGDKNPTEKMDNFSSFLPKKPFDSQHMKCPTLLSYRETSNSESETDSENDFSKIQTKAYQQKPFSKRHIKQPTSVSYKEASNSEGEESPIEKNITFRKQSNFGKIIKYDSNKKSQAHITSASEKIADKLIPIIKTNKKLTCKMVEEVDVNFQPNVKKKDTCINNSNLPCVKHCKEKLDIIASKSAIKKILLKDDNASKTHSNKENVGHYSVLPTSIDIKSDNSMNKHMKDEFILSKDHIFETLSTKDITDGINKPLNCYDFTSKSLKTKIVSVSSQLLPCSVVLYPIHLEKCDSYANFIESRNVSKSQEVLESITKVSSNTAIQIFDTNELSAKGSVLDTFLQPGLFLNKISYPIEHEISKLKTAPFENEKIVRKPIKEDLSSPLNKCKKTSDIADKSQEFEGLSENSFGESFNCTPCSVRLTRLSLDNFNTNVNSGKDKLSKSNISLDCYERLEGIVSDKQKKYSSGRNRKVRFTDKKHIACNSTDFSACVKKITSKNSKINTSTPCNTHEKSVNDNTGLLHLKNSNIVFDNYNIEEHTFCNSRSQLTSKKKSSKNNLKINTLFPENRVSKSPPSADFKRKQKPTNYRLARSYKKCSKKSPLMNAYGVEANSFKLQSKTDLSKRPRYFLSKEVSKSFKNSIKKRKASQTTGCEEQKHGSKVLRKKAQSNVMCVQCNQSIASLKALYEHLCLGKRKKGYLCCICEKIFKHYSQFKKHKRFHLSHRIALDANLS